MHVSSHYGLLRHVRECHVPADVPSWFIRKWKLKACPSCSFHFKDLSRHSKCRGKPSTPTPATRTLTRTRAACVHSQVDADGSDLAVAELPTGDVEARMETPVSVVSEGSLPSPTVGVDGSSIPDAERKAWSLVEGFSWDDILGRCPSTVASVRDYLKPLWIQALRLPLQCLSRCASDEGAWKLLFLLPSMLLTRATRQRGGKKGQGEVRKKFRQFLDFIWEPLLQSSEGSLLVSSESTTRSRLQKAERHVKDGALSRATRLLTSSGLAAPSVETLQKLRNKHPTPSRPFDNFPPSPSAAITLERDAILKALRSSPRGSAAGPSGLRFEHLRPCLEVRDLTDLLCAVVQLLVSGSPPPAVGRAMAAARLIALAKGNGDVRPIAVGECLRRLCARSVCLQEKASMAAFLSPVQYGVATPGGLEQVVHQLQAGLEAHEDWGLFKCDLSNAFNSVARATIFEEVSEHFPSLLPFTTFLYGQPSPLIYRNGDSSAVLSSQEGVHQGDPLGPFYFCIAINACLQLLQESHVGIVVAAYFDDVTILGPPEKIGDVLPELVSGLESCGLHFNPAKCELFHPDAESQVWAHGMRTSCDGTVVLGAALGSPEFAQSHYESVAQQGRSLLQSISLMESTQCAFLLLKFCANSRIAHITRLSPPDHTVEATLLHDSMIEESMAKLLGVCRFTELARKQMRLRPFNGGLGLASMFDQRHHAFLSSWADSLRQLSSRVPTLHDELALVTNTTSSTTTACALRDCHHFLSGNLDELPFTVVDLHLAPLKLQSKLNSELEAVRLSSLLEQADQSARARLLSTSCREASAWIDALPSTQQLTLSSEVFSLNVLMRLGLALPVTRGMSTCPNPKCSASVDPEGLHLLSCSKGPGRVRLHDGMVRAWHSMILSAGLRATVEQRGLYPDCRRPDIVVPDYCDGRELQLDFSATHPCLPTNLPHASRNRGAAASRREQEKRRHYSDCSGLFEPLVCEHHGCWGAAASKLLRDLSRRAGASLPGITHHQFHDFWLKALGVSLQKAMAHTILNNAEGWGRANSAIQELLSAIVHF